MRESWTAVYILYVVQSSSVKTSQASTDGDSCGTDVGALITACRYCTSQDVSALLNCTEIRRYSPAPSTGDLTYARLTF